MRLSEEIATIQLQPIVTLKCRRFLDISIFQVKFELYKISFLKTGNQPKLEKI